MLDARYEPTQVGHADYNKFVQSVQADANAWGFETRVRQKGSIAVFEAFYDGKWHQLGTEVPFAPDDASRNACIFERLWAEIQFKAAGELAKS